MTRQSIKNKVNKILSDTTKGLFSDEYWQPVQATWKALQAAGFEVTIQNTKYGQDEKGTPCQKVWHFEISMGVDKKPLYGILTAHGAGTVEEPLKRYDISAYVG